MIAQGMRLGFLAIASLFFLWAVANNLNDILIRQFQKALELSRGEAGLIQFVFYIAYFLIALPAGILLERIGYRGGLLAGLFIYALGCLLFYPASEVRSYPAFLCALFVIASGVAILETAANPLIARFGPPEKAAQRLNLAQAFNGVGAFAAPLIGGFFIFSGVELSVDTLARLSPAELELHYAREAEQVQTPYLVLAGAVLLVAAIISVVRLPSIEATETPADVQSNFDGVASALAIPHLRNAVVAQFFYVGAQVAIWSYFVDFAIDSVSGLSERQAAFLLSASLGLFMVGRFAGSALMAIVSAPRMLALAALCAAALTTGAGLLSGWASLICLIAVSFFMSIMFPTIFALGLRGAGRHTKRGSAYIVMAILGGAVFPPLAGLFADLAGDSRAITPLPFVSFIVVALFAKRYFVDKTVRVAG